MKDMGQDRLNSISIKSFVDMLVRCLLLMGVTVLMGTMIIVVMRMNYYKYYGIKEPLEDSSVVDLCLSDDSIEIISQEMKREVIGYNNILTTMYYNNAIDRWLVKLIIKKAKYLEQVDDIRKDIIRDCRYFPVMYKDSQKKDIFTYENTWHATRNYGGNRHHEGVDIMYKLNKADEVPIVSMSDGVVERKGWLKLGGYRLYIKVSERLHIYYAHLSSYASDIDVGDKVYAGQILGYMGSTGYGEEGTRDKFDVHLHIGLYSKSKKGTDIAINPYYLLRKKDTYKLIYK